MNQRDIGGLLGMGTGSAVCQQMKRLRARRSCGLDLDAQIGKIESTLGKLKGVSGKH